MQHIMLSTLYDSDAVNASTVLNADASALGHYAVFLRLSYNSN